MEDLLYELLASIVSRRWLSAAAYGPALSELKDMYSRHGVRHWWVADW